MTKPFGLCTLGATLLLLSSLPLVAGPVGREQARATAARLLGTPSEVTTSALRAGELDPAYYLFNDSERGGFAIISGEEDMTELVGYSTTGSIDPSHMPDGLARFLRSYTDQVKRVRMGGLRSTYRRVINRPQPVVKPMITTKWGQASPYHDQCPVDRQSGKHAYTGCVATAVAQVMYHHKWPVTGKGEQTHHVNGFDPQTVDFSKSNYNWGAMTPTYTAQPQGNDTEARTAVAKLMSDIGVASRMGYDISGSGVSMTSAASALVEFFNYTAVYIDREAHGEIFTQQIKSELDSGYPIVMSGAGAYTAGHAWVCDGYDENGFLHMNWGWDGAGDGYYNIDALRPSSLGIGAGGGDYNFFQDIIIAHPKKDGVPEAAPHAYDLSIFPGGKFNPTRSTQAQREPFIVTMYAVGYRGFNTVTARWGIGVFDAEGKRIQLVASTVDPEGRLFTNGSQYAGNDNIALNLATLQDGKYDLLPMYVFNKEASPTWKQMRPAVPISIEIANGQIRVVSEPKTAINLRMLRAPEATTNAYTALPVPISVRMINESLADAHGHIIVTLINDKGERSEVGRFRHDFFPYTEIDRDLLVDIPRTMAVGTYSVEIAYLPDSYVFATADGGAGHLKIENGFGPFSLKVASYNESPTLNYLGVELAGEDGEIIKDEFIDPTKHTRLSIFAYLRSPHSGFYGPISYYLRDMATGEKIELGSQTFYTDAGQVVSQDKVTVSFSIAEKQIKAGHTYRIILETMRNGRPVDLWDPAKERRYISFGTREAMPTEEITTQTLKLYPNPTTDLLYLDGADLATEVQVYSLDGRLVRRLAPEGANPSLSLGDLPRGIYMVRVASPAGVSSRRIEKL